MKDDCAHSWCYFVSFDGIWNYLVVDCYKCGKICSGYPHRIVEAGPNNKIITCMEAEKIVESL